MSVGDYVSVKIPSSNKIVAGLVEDISGNSATVRLRSAPDARSHNRDETITVPISSLQSLGVSSVPTNTSSSQQSHQHQHQRGDDFDTAASPASSSDYTGKSEDHTDPFKHFDDAGNLTVSSVTVLTAESSAELKEKKRSEAAATVFRHGIFSRYVWEFLSPIASLLRCERPLFSIAFLIMFVVVDMCRTSPEAVVSTSCFVVSRIIRDESGRSLPPPASAFTFESITGLPVDEGEDPVNTAATAAKRAFEKTLSKKQQKEEKSKKKKKNSKKSSNDNNNNNNNNINEDKKQEVVSSENFLPFHLDQYLPLFAKNFLLAIERQIEETIIFRTRIFIRDFGLFTEDLWIASGRFVVSDENTRRIAKSSLRESSLLGQVCSELKKNPKVLTYASPTKENATIIANRISIFIYCVLLCLLWSQGIRCSSSVEQQSSLANKKSSNSISNDSSSNASPEDLAKQLEIEEENGLLDDADDGYDFEGDDDATATTTSIRFQLKTEKLEYRRRHEKMKKLELEIHYPDLALKKFLKEFRNPIVIHIILICVVCIANWMFQIVPLRVIAGNPPRFQVQYSHPVFQQIFSPIEESLIDIGASMSNQTLESWLLQSTAVNVLLGLLTYVLKMKWRN